ncbi:hypothetical protein CVN76_08925 [Bacillus sp. mrc49]|uniref:Uncharacterized protein n=1 Tax=Peribacillus simplex TaxID=1478 RepID=A0A109N1X2_9BACI|nr:hypothetical protein AS888_05825 [Peribacillus simplex]PJN90639.1 hypothetical protein CVN76_08925 [Bacillus sp. mrc49]
MFDVYPILATLLVVLFFLTEGYIFYRFIKTPGTGLFWALATYGAIGIYAAVFMMIFNLTD